MSYKLIDIEGIGETYASKLANIGLTTPENYLEVACTASGRKKIAEDTGISSALILKWANHCDLIRINGIGPQYAEMLEIAGVDTVKELRHRVPQNLQAKLAEVNAEKNIANRVPSVSEVEKWVAEAKELACVMAY